MKALAITAHHDDAVLWCGGTMLRTIKLGWKWVVVGLCVPLPERQKYFANYCRDIGVGCHQFGFADYQKELPFSKNSERDMIETIRKVLSGWNPDLVFTHSSDAGGEYGGHANHDEVLKVTQVCVPQNQIVTFAYNPEFGRNGRATTARRDADYHVQLTYDELIEKAIWCRRAPDAPTNLKNLGFPCPNPEGFRATGTSLPADFIPG